MYVIENIIRNAEQNKESLNILFFSQTSDKYVKSLAKNLNHNFYAIKELGASNWSSQIEYPNIKLYDSIKEIPSRSLDCIICFGRGDTYDSASHAADVFHLPLIVVDNVCSDMVCHRPFFSQLTIEDPRSLFFRTGDIHIGTSDLITKSWSTQFSSMATTIPYVPEEFKKSTLKKILIDPNLPKQYLQQMQINLENPIFTHEIKEAAIYLNFWESINETMLECMKNNIPVITFASNTMDLKEISEKQCFIVIDNQQIPNVQHEGFVDDILKFKSTPQVIFSAKKYVDSIKINFKSCWENVLNHICGTCYMRISR